MDNTHNRKKIQEEHIGNISTINTIYCAYCDYMLICLEKIINWVQKPLIIGSNRLKFLQCLAIFTTDNFCRFLSYTNVLIKSAILPKSSEIYGGTNG